MKIDEPDLPIYTSGVLIRGASFVMWGAQTKDGLWAALRLTSLERILITPETKLKVWVQINYTEVAKINRASDHKIWAMVDLQDGSFIVTDSDSGAQAQALVKPVSVYRLQIKDQNSKYEEIAGEAIKLMLPKWRAKMAREI